MKRIRTLFELQTFLDEELVWRKREFVVIKSLVTSQSPPERINCHMRSGITLIYAHWEGFIKLASEAYLSYIANQRLTYAELSNNFVAVAAKKMLNEARASNKATVYTKVADFFANQLNSRCSKFPDETINTRANLNSEVLKEITHILGLDYARYETKALIIDQMLLGNRNHIAHGKLLNIDLEVFIDVHKTIIELLDDFHDQIEDAAIDQTYRRRQINHSLP